MNLSGTTVPALLGHRFNIQFLIAARVFSLRDSIREFIRFAYTMENLGELLSDDLVLVQLQVLGLLDQLVTGPLWRIAENLGVIEAGMYHRDLLVYIDACIDSPSKFFSGECPTLTTPPSFTLFNEEGTLLQALVNPSPSPLACDVAVRVLRACAEYLRDVLRQTMSGGEYSNPSSEVASAIESAPPTNRAVESAFAYMDFLYHKAPFARFFRRDALTCFVLNHVSRWLDGKNTRDRSIILEKAFGCIKEIVYEEREKTEQLGEAIVSKMKARKVEEDGKAQKSEARKSRIVDELGGVLLTSSAEIDRAVFGLGQSQAIHLIKAQLRFRKNVCKQKAEPRLYRFSAGKVVHGLNTLVANLKELVLADPSAGFIEEDDFRSSYLGRTCDLSTDLLFPDGAVLSGQQMVLDIVLREPF